LLQIVPHELAPVQPLLPKTKRQKRQSSSGFCLSKSQANNQLVMWSWPSSAH
jgi:hypothetical protein